jgi:hypothetical protein
VLYVPPSDPTPSRGDAGESKPLASALPPP